MVGMSIVDARAGPTPIHDSGAAQRTPDALEAVMRITVAMVLAAFGVASLTTLMPGIEAQQPACLHGPEETAVEQARRRGALGLVRAINTAQVQAHGRTGVYQPLANVSLPATPEGFAVQFAEAPGGYVFSVKDTLDPCHFAFFSDQVGVIYTAQPIR
jgi:hypothetical protein